MTTNLTVQTINGIETQAWDEARAAMTREPGTAGFQFRSSTTWKSGAVVASTFDGYKRDGLHIARPTPHELGADEPTALLGTGTDVGPTGHLVHALSHSLIQTMVYEAAARGVAIDALRIDAEGPLDLQGLLGLDDRVRPGFKQIQLHVQVESAAPAARIRALLEYAQGRAPIVQTIGQPTRVDWTFEVESTDAPVETADIRHGVNAPSLVATLGAIQQTPRLAKCRFFTSSEWLGGARVASTHPGFDQADGDLLVRHRDEEPKGYVGDQVRELLGADTGVAPEEALLQAMASCVSVTTSYHAAARGLALEAFDVDFEGDVDMRGAADLDDRVTPGYQRIRGRVFIKGGASEQALREFLAFTTSHSPMCNSVMQPVPVTVSLTCNGVPA